MKARPILMSAPMVRALLAGAKSQTRRVVKPQPPADAACAGVIHSESTSDGLWSWLDSDSLLDASIVGDDFRCPYGKPGDLLWVRENFYQYGGPVEYAADDGAPSFKRKMTPCIHMPRSASRITLRIADVRVERLQDISEDDCYSEGALEWADEQDLHHSDGTPAKYPSVRHAYRALWESINGKDSWAQNPWAWCISFDCIKRNVDDVLRDARAAA